MFLYCIYIGQVIKVRNNESIFFFASKNVLIFVEIAIFL